MTLAVVVLLCAGVVASAVLLSCRGRRHQRVYRWSADDRVRQAMSSTSTSGRRPL